MADDKKNSFLNYNKKLSFQKSTFTFWKQKPKAEMPDNHIFYSQFTEYCLNSIKNICISFIELIIFVTVLVDGLLGLATIIYIIKSNYVFAMLCWLGISFLCFQFLKLVEQRKPNKKFTSWETIKVFGAIIFGAITGIIVWPAFDKDFGELIGITFGALFGVTLKLIIEIISLDLRQKKQ